jgi:uncharacterized membrane protein
MEGNAKILGHSVHPIMIVFPLGLLATAVVFDVIFLVWGNDTFATVAYWMIAAGIVGGLLAAPFGWMDWFAIPSGVRAKTVGLAHGVVNTVVLLLFAGSWYIRSDSPARPEMMASVLSIGGFLLALVGGWLGGELVERLGIGVHEGAHPDAPSSLSTDPPLRRTHADRT